MRFFKSRVFLSGGNIFVKYIGSLFTVLFLGLYLSPEERGYFFTFLSLIGIKIFFELGFGNIITQYLAKNRALNTKQSNQNTYLFMVFVNKWYKRLALCLLVTLLVVGYFIFPTDSNTEIWIYQWLVASVSVSFFFFINPKLSIAAGLGHLTEVLRIRVNAGIFKLLTMWILLVLGFKLYSLGISILVETIIIYLLYENRLSKFCVFKLETKEDEKFDYFKIIFPAQWRIALSWISGYFSFQLFTPLTFKYIGEVESGKIGLTIMIINAIGAIPLLWINTKIPEYSEHFGSKSYSKLFDEFKKDFKISLIVLIALIVCFLGLYFSTLIMQVRFFKEYVEPYIISTIPLLLFLAATFLNHIISSFAILLRSNVEEPFLINSILLGISISISSFLLVESYGVLGLALGYFTSCLILFFPGVNIYKRNKIKYLCHY